MIPKYEGHITLIKPGTKRAKQAAEAMGNAHGYKYSEISGWDELASGAPHAYLTTHSDDPRHLLGKLRELGVHLNSAGFHVLRLKVEETIYDERYT